LHGTIIFEGKCPLKKLVIVEDCPEKKGGEGGSRLREKAAEVVFRKESSKKGQGSQVREISSREGILSLPFSGGRVLLTGEGVLPFLGEEFFSAGGKKRGGRDQRGEGFFRGRVPYV